MRTYRQETDKALPVEEMIEQAGLGRLHEFAALMGYLVLPVLVAVAVYCHLSLIPNEAKKQYRAQRLVELENEGRTRRLWRASPKELRELGASRKPDFESYTIYTVEKPGNSDAPSTLEVVVQHSDETIAIADVIAFDEKIIWEFDSDTILLDGTIRKTTQEVLTDAAVSKYLNDIREAELEIVCVGLESLADGKGEDLSSEPENPTLARRRGRALVQEMMSRYHFVADERPVNFFWLDLGRSLVPAPHGTADEQRQRAAILIALSRRVTAHEVISTHDAIASVVMRAELFGTNLSAFQFADIAPQHLNPEFDWNTK